MTRRCTCARCVAAVEHIAEIVALQQEIETLLFVGWQPLNPAVLMEQAFKLTTNGGWN